MASDPSGPGGNADGAARGSLVDDVGRVVVVATLVLLVVNGGVGSVLARIKVVVDPGRTLLAAD